MVADFQTSMKEIRDANLAFISLLTQLKEFIARNGTITISVNGTQHTLPTLPSIIEAYRGGNFDKIVLKSGASEVHIKNDNGTLQIVDADGNPVPLTVSKLKYAMLDSCSIGTAMLRECSIDTLHALGGISTDRIGCQTLNIAGLLTAASAMFQSLNTGALTANTATISSLTLHSMAFAPNVQRDIFAAPTPYNYASGNAVFDDAVGGTHTYVCAPTQGEIQRGWKSPDTMGFVGLTDTTCQIVHAPDMMTFQGDTEQSDYTSGRAQKISNCYVAGVGTHGTVPAYSTTAIKGPGSYVAFGYLLGWPVRSFIADPASDPSLPAAMQGNTRGAICLHEFSADDVGRIIYIRTYGNPWKIPRRLTVTYENGVPQGGVLDLGYEVPPYTSLRVRLSRNARIDGDRVTYYNVLELT